MINIDVEQAPFARLLTKEAYALGAEEVIVKWTDDFVTRETYLHTSEERMTNIPQYKVDESLDMIEKKASRLSVRSADPDALNGVDGKKLAAVKKLTISPSMRNASRPKPTKSAGPSLPLPVRNGRRKSSLTWRPKRNKSTPCGTKSSKLAASTKPTLWLPGMRMKRACCRKPTC